MKKHRSNSESDKTLLKIPSIDESGDESIEDYDDGSGHFESIEHLSSTLPSSTSYPIKSPAIILPSGSIGAAVAILHDEIDPIEEEDDIDIEALDEDTLIAEQHQQKQQTAQMVSTTTVQSTSEAHSHDSGETKTKSSADSSLVSKCKKLSLKSKKLKKQQSSTTPSSAEIDTSALAASSNPSSSTDTTTTTPTTTTTISTTASSSSKSSSNKVGYNNLIASLLRTTTL